MKYNAKYNRWFTEDGKVYRTINSKFIECSQSNRGNGYLKFTVRINGQTKTISTHRAIWETFRYNIPDGFEIDHLNTNKKDNRLVNLRCVQHKDNMRNPITKEKQKTKAKENWLRREDKWLNPWSSFGLKFFEHYGIHRHDNTQLYNKESCYYYRHNKKCSWE